MKTVLLLSAALMLTACSTVSTGTKVAKTTGKVAAETGKIAYKAGATTGKVVMGAGRETAAASAQAVKGVTRAPEAENINRIGDKGSFGEVALTPLSDINLRRQRVPEKLKALNSPYEAVRDSSCRGLYVDIRDWNQILGPDMDGAPEEGRFKKTKRQMKETSLDVAEAGVGSFIPFRGLVRAATGATKRDNMIRWEYRKGVARRAYLRGLAVAKRC